MIMSNIVFLLQVGDKTLKFARTSKYTYLAVIFFANHFPYVINNNKNKEMCNYGQWYYYYPWWTMDKHEKYMGAPCGLWQLTKPSVYKRNMDKISKEIKTYKLYGTIISEWKKYINKVF